MMRYTPEEKQEIIRLVENSDLSVKQTLEQLGVPRSTFYRWYQQYLERGVDGLADPKRTQNQFWNQIPQQVKEQVVEVALEHTDFSSRQVAWYITDQDGYFISESSVYRILKQYDLITSPVFQVVSAKDRFEHPTTQVNEMWQTDFTQFKVIDWGYYYLSTVLDDYSRYIIAWRLAPTMGTLDVETTLNVALARTGVNQVKVHHRPRLLSDNGPAFVSKAFAQYLKQYQIKHIRGAPYHPQTQGKIERYHRSMKSVVKLDTYYSPDQLHQAIESFVQFYNHERYHESLDNVTPADMFLGRYHQIQTRRDEVKQLTLQQRRSDYLHSQARAS